MRTKEFENFNILPFEEKVKIIFSEGAFIAWRKNSGRRFALYCMGEFFVEISFLKDQNAIENIDVFSGDDAKIDLYVNFESVDSFPHNDK